MKKYTFTNQKAFREWFNEAILPEMKELDAPSVRQSWNNIIDDMMRNGEIPERAGSWCCPNQGKVKLGRNRL